MSTLIKAIISENIDRVLSEIEQGADVNYNFGNPMLSAFNIQDKSKIEPIVKILVAHGASAGGGLPFDDSPFSIAHQLGLSDLFKWMNENRYTVAIQKMFWKQFEFTMWVEHGCDVSEAENIYSLFLSSSRLPVLLECIGQLRNLESLSLNDNQLTTLPESFGQLTNLRSLHLSENQLINIPESFGQLRNLEILYINNNKLSNFPESFLQLANLQSLKIYNNQLKTLPESFGQLANLQSLNIYNNQLKTLPESFGQLRNLESLCLSENQLTTLPESFGQLRNLESLDLYNNQLINIPESFGQLGNLQYLYLQTNKLTTLPKSFGQLRNLLMLYIDNNKLTTLPESFGQLGNLEILGIGHNNFTSLPPLLGNLQHLEEFYYNNNPIEHIPANVLRMIDRTETVQGVYTDAQSVHNSSIQKSLLDSVNRLLAIPLFEKEVINSILTDSVLSQDTKARLIEYSEDTSVHTVLNLTFSEMLVVVWNRIETLASRDEIKKTLNTEMQDAECKCFTGRISRLVNCLAGYDDLVVVEIADSEQIGTIVELIRSQLGENYTVDEHRRLVCDALTERGYGREVIDEWVRYIE